MNEPRYSSVWDSLEDTSEAAENMKIRATLLLALQDYVSGLGMTQVDAAQRLGITQPRLNDLLRGRIDKFSLNALVHLLYKAGMRLGIEVKRAA
ncbi:MAG TPA: XRE family transcriptional regulator [Candidatus Competibacteraceae bacterium]|nr:XRE family transcriptional regulator [Candidatus Competibacteraceae bacterium]